MTRRKSYIWCHKHGNSGEGETRLHEKGARFPLQLMSLWVSSGGPACRGWGGGAGRTKAKQSKSTESLESSMLAEHRRVIDVTKKKKKKNNQRQQESTWWYSVRACQDRRKWRIMRNTWGGEPQRHRRTVDRWASCLSDRLYTCHPGFRWAVDFQ